VEEFNYCGFISDAGQRSSFRAKIAKYAKKSSRRFMAALLLR